MGRSSVGTGTVQEVRLLPLPMRKGDIPTLSGVRNDSVPVSEGTLPSVRRAPVRRQTEAEGKSEVGRRQSTRHSAHGMHYVLAPGWHAHVCPAVHGVIVWQAPGVLQGRGRATRIVERS